MWLIMIFITFLIMTAAVSAFLTNYTIRQHIEKVITVSHTLEYWTGTFQIEHNNSRAEETYIRMLNSWTDFINADITVTNLDGEILGTTSEVSSVPAVFTEKISNNGRLICIAKFGDEYTSRQYIIGVAVRYQGNIVGAMFFTTPIKVFARTIIDILFIFFIGALLSIFTAVILIYTQSKRISKPIGEINRAVRNIAAGNFSERVNVTSADEIGQLASNFNFMADSIENLERMQSGFVSDVSHELRTPMTSISGFAQSILDGTIPKEEADSYLKIIVDESKRLTKLVNDLLDMSKMSSKEYQLTIEKFDLNELVRLCIISLESKITDKNLDLDVDFETDSLEVLGDKDSIQRVILNLIDNAIKFSFENTLIKISTRTQDKKAFFSVGNFGIGIDDKDLSNVFTRFYKTDKSRTRERSGAGLGLSLCRNIMKLHRQSIWVESNPAKDGSNVKYTQFTFSLEKA